MYLIYRLTEDDLQSLVKKAIERHVSEGLDIASSVQSAISECRAMLNEMAFKRRDYKEKIDNVSAQIIENWCLVRYCKLFMDDKRCMAHWADELRGHLITAARYNIKGTSRSEDKEQVIREIWSDNDYYEPKTIEYVIYNKFRKESIETSSKEFLQVIADCIGEFNGLIQLISVGSLEDISAYVEKLTI